MMAAHWRGIFGNYLRVRGEYLVVAGCGGCGLELPPRARRIPPTRQNNIKHRGTTSACAENTPQKQPRYQCIQNYLRVRGEYDVGLFWGSH